MASGVMTFHMKPACHNNDASVGFHVRLIGSYLGCGFVINLVFWGILLLEGIRRAFLFSRFKRSVFHCSAFVIKELVDQ